MRRTLASPMAPPEGSFSTGSARSACGGQVPTSSRGAHSDTISVVSNRPSAVAHQRPDGARLLVTTAASLAGLLFVWSTHSGAML